MRNRHGYGDMETIDYQHEKNEHTMSGARAALEILFANKRPDSILDVGCGRGTWVCAASELGVLDTVALMVLQLQINSCFRVTGLGSSTCVMRGISGDVSTKRSALR